MKQTLEYTREKNAVTFNKRILIGLEIGHNIDQIKHKNMIYSL